MAGGGVPGKAVGIAHIIITGVGLIITMFQAFILTWIQAGEDTTEPIIGTDTSGTMNGSLIADFSRTGRTGIMIDIGNGKEPGAYKAINLGRIKRYRNQDIKDSNNISRGPKFGDIRNRCSNKDNSNKDNSNKDSLMFNKYNISHRASIFRDISSLNNSILNLRAGSRRWNHNTRGIKEN